MTSGAHMPPCLILAGGLGTRMRPFTDSAPKALLRVNGQPFVGHQLRLVAAWGIRHVVMSIGYRGEMIRDYVEDGRSWGLTVDYVDDGDTPMGTAGAVREAIGQGLLDEDFALLYGDSYLPIDFAPVAGAFRTSALPALMTVLRNEGGGRGNTAVHDGRVVRYDKTSAMTAGLDYIDYGLSLLEPDVVTAHVPPNEPADLSVVFGALSADGKLAAYEVRQRFYEVGSPEGVRELEEHLSMS